MILIVCGSVCGFVCVCVCVCVCIIYIHILSQLFPFPTGPGGAHRRPSRHDSRGVLPSGPQDTHHLFRLCHGLGNVCEAHAAARRLKPSARRRGCDTDCQETECQGARSEQSGDSIDECMHEFYEATCFPCTHTRVSHTSSHASSHALHRFLLLTPAAQGAGEPVEAAEKEGQGSAQNVTIKQGAGISSWLLHLEIYATNAGMVYS